MILTCSSCATRFLVDPAAVGPTGRSVRCAKCQHVWYQEPPEDLPRSLGGGPAAAMDPQPQVAPLSARKPEPLRRGSNLPAIPKQRKRWTNAAAWGGLATFVIAFLAGGYIYRDSVVQFWSPAGKLYQTLGIELSAGAPRLVDVSFAQVDRNGVSVLEVKGAIINDGGTALPQPEIIVTLRDGDGNEIYRWRDRPTALTVSPGGRVEFMTSVSDPPADARNLEVTLAGP